MGRWIALLLGTVALACSSAPERGEEEILFLDGPEFAAAGQFTDEALGHWDKALMTQDPVEKSQSIAAADAACKKAQLQYEQAMKVYSHYQRQEIETEMASVHLLRVELQRERYR